MIRVAVIGPESSGKTTLAQQLAEHFDTAWVPELARDYLAERAPGDYRAVDLLAIARGQRALESAASAKARRILICDTSPVVLQVWHQLKLGPCPPELADPARLQTYDLHLLLATDLPWEPDPLREDPSPRSRQRIFRMYRDILRDAGVPYEIVRGAGPARFESAVAAIEHRLDL